MTWYRGSLLRHSHRFRVYHWCRSFVRPVVLLWTASFELVEWLVQAHPPPPDYYYRHFEEEHPHSWWKCPQPLMIRLFQKLPIPLYSMSYASLRRIQTFLIP